MNRILVAHGTRKASGVALIGDIADRVAAALDAPVDIAFVDVLGPTPAEVLRAMPERPAVLVPAFLSRGYHVRTDIPAHVRDSDHPDVTVAPALGPDPRLVRVVADRLAESGWRPNDSVILAAAGTSDGGALRDLHTTATSLSAVTGARVDLAFAATGEPHIADAVSAARRRGARRVVVASYLLSDGLFQDRLRASGADIVTEPLGTHPGLVRLIAARFRRARIPVAA
ncbi:cobalamin biosynthesis protein CbiX [Mycolicibacterium litorale]|uniref:Cobalamin biosynthesis protein CbiX n=1 Tax=Mycolicibacterium litorale TaxID=758802 RepID=A0A6S6NYB7_9MYCO|nr:sirohydrochlorin chelatase [Mycolicibacterium litorale]BCI51015.1 cobalamin biosynthesis protein CbiX [Mycolicibacterium litorale]